MIVAMIVPRLQGESKADRKKKRAAAAPAAAVRPLKTQTGSVAHADAHVAGSDQHMVILGYGLGHARDVLELVVDDLVAV